MGITLTDHSRINACILYVVEKEIENGHTVFTIDSLYNSFIEELASILLCILCQILE